MSNLIAMCVVLVVSLSSSVGYGPLLRGEFQLAPQSAARAARQDGRWRASTYRGLTVGKSKRANMLRVLGRPQWSGSPGDQSPGDPDPEIWHEYEKGVEFEGKLTVVVKKRSGIISRIDLYPKELSKDAALKHFGEGYRETKYAFDNCLDDGESAPIYESADGQITYLEYRERGIALVLNERNKVEHISFVKDPIGSASSKCRQAEKNH